MKIKSKLYVLVGTTLLLMLSTAISVGFAHWQVASSLQLQNYVTELVNSASGLNYQYRNLVEKDNRNTWKGLEQTHQQLNALLINPAELDAKQSVLLTSIKQSHDSIHAQFKLLNLQNGLDKTVTSNQIIDKLFNQIEAIRIESFQLSNIVNKKIQQTLNTRLLWALLITVFIGLLLTLISIWIYKGVISSLTDLFRGFTTSSNGDYDYSVTESGSDEISHLSKLFNQMQRKLERATVNKQQLQTTVDQQKQKLKILIQTDSLTLVSNRRAYINRLAKEKALSIRNNISLSMLMIDIDFFKDFNERYGHEAGDAVLKKVAQTIQHSLPRKTDFIARYGGEEFVVILPGTVAQGASLVSERIMNEIKKLSIEHRFSADHNIVSVSIGIASQKGRKLVKENLLEQVQQAMLQAKNNGRNQYKVFK